METKVITGAILIGDIVAVIGTLMVITRTYPITGVAMTTFGVGALITVVWHVTTRP